MKTWLRHGCRVLVVFVLAIALAGIYVARSSGQETVTIKVALEEGRMANVGRFVATEYMKTHPNIKVEIVGLPDTHMHDKLVVALTGGKYVYDALEFFPGWGAAFVKSGWVRPLDQWWNEKDPYFSDFLMVDTLSMFKGAPEKWAGKYYGLPFNTDVKMLVYRKDLYEKNGLKPPKTWDAFVKNSMKLQNREKGFYGYGYPAMISDAGDANTAVIIHLWAMGGELFGPKLKPTFATPTNIRAFTELVRTIPKISAPGLYETDYNEENELFASGKVAHIIQWMPAAAGTVDDPKTSKVAGKVGYAPSYGLATRGTGWATGITTTSPHPQETFDFLKFMSNREMLGESLVRFTNGLVRKSLAEDQGLVKKLPWIPGMVGALRTARVLPSIPEMTAIRVAISKETIRALKGQITPAQALKNMDEQAYKILEKAGYFK